MRVDSVRLTVDNRQALDSSDEPGSNGDIGKDVEQTMEAEDATGARGARTRGERDAQAADDGSEGEKPRGLVPPYRLSAQEVEEHSLTCCPPRAWCDHCVKG